MRFVQVHILFALHINTNRFSNAISKNDITKSLPNHHVVSPGHRGLDVRDALVDGHAALHADS
jgi:hypothetical protein